MSDRPGFGDLAAERLRRETELDRIAGVLNWAPIARRLEKLCCKDDGRPPFPPIVMFRALLLAQWYHLTDRGLEEALCDRLSFRRFVGLKIEQATPDHSTLCRFRERLYQRGVDTELLALINAQLEDKNLMVKRGTLIDATVVQTAAARPDVGSLAEDRVDPDAAFLRREGKNGATYGYKAHVAVDQGSLLVRAAQLTPANVTETQVADELIRAAGDVEAVYADKAYDTKARRELLRELGIEDGILHRANKHHSLAPDELTRNSKLSKVRFAVETVFAVLKRGYGFRRTRYFDLISNQLQLTLLAICFNLRRALVLLTHARTPSAA
jgi:transposase, IS5 family